MGIKILRAEQESCTATRFIGKKYLGSVNWEEWWSNDWFDILESIQGLSINDNGYIGAVHIVEGMPEYWIGMFFPVNTEVPSGFEYVDIDPLDYAVFYLYGTENSNEFYTMETHDMCVDELKKHHWKRKENDWCFERYNCPRFTTPDADGNVILDCAISIESKKG